MFDNPRNRGLAALVALIWIALAGVFFTGGLSGDATAPGETAVAEIDSSYGDLDRAEGMGGHTIARHIAKTDFEIVKRLERDNKISASSSYTDQKTAQTVVDETIQQNASQIKAWLNNAAMGNTLALRYRGRKQIGRGMDRNEDAVGIRYNAQVVLERAEDGTFFVLTSYPTH